jgi:hypothetical protein
VPAEQIRRTDARVFRCSPLHVSGACGRAVEFDGRGVDRGRGHVDEAVLRGEGGGRLV